MKITVTGATGFIGSHLAQGFMNGGHEVTLLVRDPGKIIFALKNCRVAKGDILDPVSIRDALRGADAVAHAAAYVGEWGTHDEYFQANVLGTQNMIDACVESGVKRFLHISSNSVYGDGEDHIDTPEDSPYGENGLPYGDSKIEAERRVFAAHKAGKIVATALRPSMVWGPRDRQFLPKIIDALSKGLMVHVGGGRKRVGLTHADNIVDIARRCLATEISHGRAYNVDDDDRRTMRDLVRALCVRLGYREPRVVLPAIVGKGVAAGSEWIWRAAKIKTPPLLTKMGVAILSHDNDVSVERAKKELGYQPKDLFDERMDAYIRSFRAGE